jgi:hypothetical protein
MKSTGNLLGLGLIGISLSAIADVAVDAAEAMKIIQSRCDVPESAYKTAGETYGWRRVSWTGQCVKGEMHGPGTLTLDYFGTSAGVEKVYWRDIQTGLMHHGKRIGPWRMDGPASVRGYYSWGEGAPIPGMYQRNPDGSFSQVMPSQEGGKTVIRVVEGTQAITAKEVEDAMKAAVGGTGAEATQLTFRSRLLIDLIPGGKVVKARESDIPQIGSKTLALVVATGTEAELVKLDAFQSMVRVEAAKPSNAKIRADMLKLSAAIDKQAFINELVVFLRSYFKNVVVMNDLASFKASGHDYAMVFDFSADINGRALLDGLSRDGAGTPGDTAWKNRSVGLRCAFFLLNRDLALVAGQNDDLTWQRFDVPTLEGVIYRLTLSLQGDRESGHPYPYLFSMLNGYLLRQKSPG